MALWVIDEIARLHAHVAFAFVVHLEPTGQNIHNLKIEVMVVAAGATLYVVRFADPCVIVAIGRFTQPKVSSVQPCSQTG